MFVIMSTRENIRLIARTSCRCGAQFETVEHYLLECRLYYAQRQRVKNNLNHDFELNFDLLTSGTENCNKEQNKDIKID